MKKILSLSLALLLCLSLAACGGGKTPTVDVKVGVSDGGMLVVPYKTVSVPDADGDGAVSIEDTLIAAHDAFYNGGAKEGFAAKDTEYGRSIVKFWGIDNGGGYGYYLNDQFVLPDDDVHAGDELFAYSYQDMVGWSDTYAYFTEHTASAAAGEEVKLQLMMLVYDENWNLGAKPCEGAFLMIDGAAAEVFTDAEGFVTVSFDEPGEHVVSALHNQMVLVPAVCNVTVK